MLCMSEINDDVMKQILRQLEISNKLKAIEIEVALGDYVSNK